VLIFVAIEPDDWYQLSNGEAILVDTVLKKRPEWEKLGERERLEKERLEREEREMKRRERWERREKERFEREERGERVERDEWEERAELEEQAELEELGFNFESIEVNPAELKLDKMLRAY
jgi:hypothetical protein